MATGQDKVESRCMLCTRHRSLLEMSYIPSVSFEYGCEVTTYKVVALALVEKLVQIYHEAVI